MHHLSLNHELQKPCGKQLIQVEEEEEEDSARQPHFRFLIYIDTYCEQDQES